VIEDAFYIITFMLISEVLINGRDLGGAEGFRRVIDEIYLRSGIGHFNLTPNPKFILLA